jgi:hypothetical protein
MLRALLAAFALCVAAGVAAQPSSPETPPPAKAAPKPAAKPPAKKKISGVVRPTWIELSPEQRQVLAPLQDDWENLERERRLKWIGIAKRYPKMKPDEQARMQRRMQAWTKLTPEQRRQARESYKNMAKDKEQHGNRRDQWAEYQALPPEERETLVPPPTEKKRR